MSKRDLQSPPRFWGHLGVARLSNQASSEWFPITAQTAIEIQELMSGYSSYRGWVGVETASNRMVIFNPEQAMISLLDDADEWPDGDLGPTGPLPDYAGIDGKIYRSMAAWAEGGGNFGSAVASTDQAEALSVIRCANLEDRPEVLNAFLRNTRIHYLGGGHLECQVDRDCLLEMVDIQGDSALRFVSVRHAEGINRYLPLNMLMMLDLPLIELEAARLEDLA